jgi:hypothetical protein
MIGSRFVRITDFLEMEEGRGGFKDMDQGN